MSSENLKISIITINYNNREGLAETMRSVLAQTYENIEYILIDGGSVDGSKEIIEKWQDRLAYWVSESDSGIYNAMNKGIAVSTGAYVLFINSGDTLVDAEVIADVVKVGLKEDLVYGNVASMDGNRRRDWCTTPELTFNLFFKESIPHQATFTKRSLFDIVGLYNEKLKIVSDWEFSLLAVCKYNCSYKYIDRFIAVFNEDGISSSVASFATRNAERDQVFDHYFPTFIKDYEQFAALDLEMKKIAYFSKARHFVKRFLKKVGIGPS